MVLDFEHVVLRLDLPYPVIEVVELLHDCGLDKVGIQNFTCVLINILLLELILVVCDG